MSLCDKCFAPGSCCRNFDLSSGGYEIATWTDEGAEAAVTRVRELNLPFEPLGVKEVHEDEEGREYQSWRWMCPKVSPEGRCTIYEDRPALCRIYEPLSDQLCVHWRGAEGDEQNVISILEL